MIRQVAAISAVLFPAVLLAQSPSRIEVVDHRPVAKALDQFERLGAVAIHYEDVRYENMDDIEDVSNQVRKADHVGQTRRVLIPKSRTLSSSFSVDEGGKFANALSVELAVQGLLAANNAASMPGRFELDRYGDQDIFVLPTEVRGVDGAAKANASVLGTSITISLEKANGAEALKTVLAAISRATSQRIVAGMVPFTALANSEMTITAKQRPAGHVLADMLKQMGGVWSMRLLYGPDVGYYALNLQPVVGAVPDVSSPPPSSELPSSGRRPWDRVP